MADALATKAIQSIGSKQIDLINDDIRIILVDASYTVNLATHDFLDDVPGGNRIGTAVALSGKSFTDGVFNATSPITYGATSVIAQGAWIYQHDTATPSLTLDSQRRLIFWMDGKMKVTAAAPANSGATTVYVDPLEAPLPTATTFTMGGVSATTSSGATEGARSILVTALGSALSLAASGDASKGTGWPIPASAGGVTINLYTGTNKVFRIAPR